MNVVNPTAAGVNFRRTSLHGTHAEKPLRYGSNRFDSVTVGHLRGPAIAVDMRKALAQSGTPNVITKDVVDEWARDFQPRTMGGHLSPDYIKGAASIALLRVLGKDVETSDRMLVEYPCFADADSAAAFIDSYNEKTDGNLRVLYYGAPGVEETPDVQAVHAPFERNRIIIVNNCNLAGQTYSDGALLYVDPAVDVAADGFPDALPLSTVQAISLDELPGHLGRHGLDVYSQLALAARIHTEATRIAREFVLKDRAKARAAAKKAAKPGVAKKGK